MADFTLEAYRLEDAPAVVALWNSTSLGTTFPLLERLWRQQTEGDPDFEPDDAILARAPSGEIIGCVLTKIWRGKDVSVEVKPALSNYQSRGFIAALVVAPQHQRQGIGHALVERAETQLKAAGKQKIRLGENMRHFFPGLPTELPGLEIFFAKFGYQLDELETDLRRSLEDWISLPPPAAVADGRFYFTQGQPDEQAAILAFLQRSFPGRWYYDTDLFFKQGGLPQDITLLKSREGVIEGFLMNYHRESRVLGPGIYWSELLGPNYGGIGPLGVSDSVRGLKLGLALVAAGVDYLRSRGVTDCAIDWTTLVEFYGRLGFQPWKQYRRAVKEF